MSSKTVKALLRTPERSKFINLPVHVNHTSRGSYIMARIGNTGQYVSLIPEQARKLADTLHDRVDQIEQTKETKE